MVGPWFTTPWWLVSPSQRAVAWRVILPNFPPSDQFATPRAAFPFATSCHWPMPTSHGFQPKRTNLIGKSFCEAFT